VPEDYATALPRPGHGISARSCAIATSGRTKLRRDARDPPRGVGASRLARAVPGRLSLVQNPESWVPLVQRPGSRLRTGDTGPRTQDQRLGTSDSGPATRDQRLGTATRDQRLGISDCVSSRLRLFQKSSLHEHFQDCIALDLIDSPQSPSLPGSQLEAWKLQVFRLDPVDQRRRRRSWKRKVWCVHSRHRRSPCNVRAQTTMCATSGNPMTIAAIRCNARSSGALARARSSPIHPHG
jgi:hypothetical protein